MIQGMITIPVQLTDELAGRVLPLQDRLPEIIELGLRQLAGATTTSVASPLLAQVVEALTATGVVTLPASRRRPDVQRRPVKAGGPPASEMILAERRSSYESDK